MTAENRQILIHLSQEESGEFEGLRELLGMDSLHDLFRESARFLGDLQTTLEEEGAWVSVETSHSQDPQVLSSFGKINLSEFKNRSRDDR